MHPWVNMTKRMPGPSAAPNDSVECMGAFIRDDVVLVEDAKLLNVWGDVRAGRIVWIWRAIT